jgi:hypothetical protein
MDPKFKFTLLVVSGTVCVLAALMTMAYMYHAHATQLFMPTPDGALASHWSFLVFVGIPSIVTAVVGLFLIGLGIVAGRGGQSDD